MPELTIVSRDADTYAAQLIGLDLPHLNIAQCAKSFEDVDLHRVELLLSEPALAAPVIQHCTQLKWLQSTWAGNTPLLKQAKRDYVLTGVKGIFGDAMREYVFAYLLYFERNIAAFGHPVNADDKKWQQPQVGTLQAKRLGILGAGSIAKSLIPVAKAFEMQVVGANRSGISDQDYDAIFDIDSLHQFAEQLDYLVCLLPDTPETENIVNAAFLKNLPQHCVIINAGRGATIDDDALIAALAQGRLKAAVLDVFRQEPLPASHPYWAMENVYITQHTAAISDPGAVINIFASNYRRYLADQPLNYVIDFERGY